MQRHRGCQWLSLQCADSPRFARFRIGLAGSTSREFGRVFRRRLRLRRGLELKPVCVCFKKRAARRGSPLKGRPVGPCCHPASLRSADSLRGGGDELAREPGFLASGGRRVRQVGGPGTHAAGARARGVSPLPKGGGTNRPPCPERLFVWHVMVFTWEAPVSLVERHRS